MHEVLAEAMNRPVQRVNGALYLRGLLEEAACDSLEPLVLRLGGNADYQSMQQFLADSPWDPAGVVSGWSLSGWRQRSVGRRGCWMTRGFRRMGSDSPGVKRQYSGTLGKVGNL